MFKYFYDFIEGFLQLGNVTLTTVCAQTLALALAITVIYLFTKLVFPKDTTVKKAVFIMLYAVTFIAILYSNGINLITISQTLAQTGGV